MFIFSLEKFTKRNSQTLDGIFCPKKQERARVNRSPLENKEKKNDKNEIISLKEGQPVYPKVLTEKKRARERERGFLFYSNKIGKLIT